MRRPLSQSTHYAASPTSCLVRKVEDFRRLNSVFDQRDEFRKFVLQRAFEKGAALRMRRLRYVRAGQGNLFG